MRVKVYFNLHKKMFSVVALSGPNKNRVIAHTNSLMLRDTKFRVQSAGRQKVLKEKKKNVHAFVYGYITEEVSKNLDLNRVTYNPYKYNSFVIKESECPIYESNFVRLNVESQIPFMFAE